MRSGAGVGEALPDRLLGSFPQDGGHPVVAGHEGGQVGWVRWQACGHCEDLAQSDGLDRCWHCGRVGRQQFGQGLIDAPQLPLVDGDADEHGHHALGHREDVAGGRRGAVVVALEHRPAVHADQNRPDLVEGGADVEERLDALLHLRRNDRVSGDRGSRRGRAARCRRRR
jgi:hypothetical protein